MILTEFGQALWQHAIYAADALAQAPAPSNAPKEINTEGVLGLLATKVVPILLAVLGIIFIGRASKGEVSRVLTSSAIAIIGLAFIAGAASLLFFGESLINVLFK
jgi:hypothetical protein